MINLTNIQTSIRERKERKPQKSLFEKFKLTIESI